MIQFQILNKILSDKSFDLVIINGLTEDHFSNYKDEFNFIKNHYEVYKNVPDKITFVDKFDYWDIIECTESDQYLLQTLQEDIQFKVGADIINNVVPILEKDANEGTEYLIKRLPELNINLSIGGVDLTKSAEIRYNAYLDNKNFTQDKLIKTGFPEMDEILYGWLPGEDLITVLGRINEGKSWIMTQLAVAAWLQGKRVAMYNSEMSSNIAGYRVDTLLSNISNTALFTKNKIIHEEYKNHIEEFKKKNNCFLVATKKELNGNLTISKIKTLIEKNKLDVFFIDQYSGMVDENATKWEDRKAKYARIAEELMDISMQYKIPIIGAVQANRKSIENKDKEDSVPELDNISDADEIGALSTRVISLRNIGAGLKFKIIKNRYGNKGDSFLYYWDIDKGTFTLIPSNSSSDKKKIENRKKYNDKTDAF